MMVTINYNYGEVNVLWGYIPLSFVKYEHDVFYFKGCINDGWDDDVVECEVHSIESVEPEREYLIGDLKPFKVRVNGETVYEDLRR
ncbi:MAG: hypothetical protein DRJ03_07995 [Chloroflexi bacterium]|nr:MAG: hypothetical protein DRJ03_07995 [Chloroflexota bacterium]